MQCNPFVWGASFLTFDGKPDLYPSMAGALLSVHNQYKFFNCKERSYYFHSVFAFQAVHAIISDKICSNKSMDMSEMHLWIVLLDKAVLRILFSLTSPGISLTDFNKPGLMRVSAILCFFFVTSRSIWTAAWRCYWNFLVKSSFCWFKTPLCRLKKCKSFEYALFVTMKFKSFIYSALKTALQKDRLLYAIINNSRKFK